MDDLDILGAEGATQTSAPKVPMVAFLSAAVGAGTGAYLWRGHRVLGAVLGNLAGALAGGAAGLLWRRV